MNGKFAEDDSPDVDLPTTKKEESQVLGDDTESDRGNREIDNDAIPESDRDNAESDCDKQESEHDDKERDRVDSMDGVTFTTMDGRPEFDTNMPHRNEDPIEEDANNGVESSLRSEIHT
jgi:hypothetical protein